MGISGKLNISNSKDKRVGLPGKSEMEIGFPGFNSTFVLPKIGQIRLIFEEEKETSRPKFTTERFKSTFENVSPTHIYGQLQWVKLNYTQILQPSPVPQTSFILQGTKCL